MLRASPAIPSPPPGAVTDPLPRHAERAAGEGVALGDIGRLLRRHWLAILLPTLAALAAAIAFVQLVPPRYTGEAKLLLESRDSALTRLQQERGDAAQPIDEQAVASQVQVVMSRDLAREAIRRLNLVGNREFDPTVEGIGSLQRLLIMLGLVPSPLDRDPEDRVLERYFDRLLVYSAGKSRILTIEFRSRDPDLAARGANTIADLYLASLAAAKVDTARFASTWLGSNVETLRSRVAEAEAKVEAFRARNGLIGGLAGSGGAQPIGAQQLTELSSQLTQARAAQADAAAKAKLIKDMIRDGRAFEIPDVANNELIRRLVEQRITLRAQLALEGRTLLPQHPRMKELTAQVTDLEGQIRAAADRTVRTLENDARIAGSRVESLQAAVDAQREVVAKGNSSEVQLRALEREAKVQREQLESYLARYREAAARDAESAAPADARVVSRAIVPDTPSFPKKLPIIGFTTAVAFLLAAGSVLARSLIADDPDDLRGRGRPRPRRAAVLADVSARPDAPAPAPAAGGAAAALAEPEAGAAEEEDLGWGAPPASAQDPLPAPAMREEPYEFDALVARLASVESAGDGRRVLILGSGGAGEPEALALALGRSLARSARAVLLPLDAAAGGAPGLTDIVLGEAPFGEAIQRDPGSRLHRVGPGSHAPGVLLDEREGLGLTFDALGQAYDWILCVLRDDGRDPGTRALASATCLWMDAVVIASNAPADDADLVALYALAEGAGVPEVIVAQDRAPPPVAVPAYPLRRSA
ncbi:GumC family protein [Methylobacterium sp. WSM2598]|uniref:GumC family protein n=1 Tax=Methylobacterium sp. WSM2598 TaxID=398261 RepID=UPI0003617260|nr:exopolysaccharide transport family protein [Methylobacterium sp. WSM2598]